MVDADALTQNMQEVLCNHSAAPRLERVLLVS